MSSTKEKKRINLHLNIIDFVIIVLVLAIIGGIIFRIYSENNPRRSALLQEYEVYVEINNVFFTIPSYLTAGSIVYSEDGDEIGTLMTNNEAEGDLAMYSTAAEVIVSDGNGGFVTTQYPDQSVVDATGAMLCSGIMEDSGRFLLNGTDYITPGDQLDLHTEMVDFTVTVLAIESHS